MTYEELEAKYRKLARAVKAIHGQLPEQVIAEFEKPVYMGTVPGHGDIMRSREVYENWLRREGYLKDEDYDPKRI